MSNQYIEALGVLHTIVHFRETQKRIRIYCKGNRENSGALAIQRQLKNNGEKLLCQ